MSLLLTNSFELPPDNWYQISALGEFTHNPTGLVQLIDAESCRTMVERFQGESAQPNFPGILIDFDHFSLDHDKPSEAAGWIVQLEQRPNGLWAQIRWTDKGEQAVRGGRYRFISPVFRQDECFDLGNKKIRPLHLVNAAVTNDPNISGMVPLSNKRVEPAPAPVRTVPTIFVNREPPGFMDDDQRRAMFAHMHGGGGYGGGGGSSTTDYSPTRDSDARIETLKGERERIAAREPTAPELRTFTMTDPRKLESDLLREGLPLADIRTQVKAAEEQNRQTKKALWDIRERIHAKYKDPQKRKAAFQAELDKIEAVNRHLTDEYLKAKADHNAELAGVDDKIRLEEIRRDEAQAAADQKAANEQAKADSRAGEKALREQIEREKAAARQAEKEARDAQKKAEAEAKEKDPVRQVRNELRRRSLYWQSLARGDNESAAKLYPEADHEANRKDITGLDPEKVAKRFAHEKP